MKLTRTDGTIKEQPIHIAMCGIRIKSVELNYKDITDLLRFPDEGIREQLNHLLTRFPPP